MNVENRLNRERVDEGRPAKRAWQKARRSRRCLGVDETRRDGEKWTDWGCILHMEPTRLGYGLEVGVEIRKVGDKEREQFKMTPRFGI